MNSSMFKDLQGPRFKYYQEPFIQFFKHFPCIWQISFFSETFK